METSLNIKCYSRGPILLLALFFVTSCFQQEAIEIVHLTGNTMGTSYNIKYVPNDSFPIDKKLVSSKVESLLIDFNLIASTYDPQSEISKINRASSGDRIKTSSIFRILMTEAVELNRLSQGIFDPSLSPLINLWGFGHKGRRSSIPSDKEIEKTLSYCGMSNFDFDNGYIIKKKTNAELDFSAFAKGYGVDLIVMYLESVQMDDYFVEIGGEIRTRSSKKIWTIGIEKPEPGIKGSITEILQLNGAIATSGDYRNFYNHAGKKYSHGINFRSGQPVENEIASASVFSKDSAMRADAWATSLMVSESMIEAIDLVNKNNLSALVIYREKDKLKTYRSSSWKREFNDD